jgi:hypothetical protein
MAADMLADFCEDFAIEPKYHSYGLPVYSRLDERFIHDGAAFIHQMAAAAKTFARTIAHKNLDGVEFEESFLPRWKDMVIACLAELRRD